MFTSEDRVSSRGAVKSLRATGPVWAEMPCGVRKVMVMVMSRGKVSCDPGQLRWTKEAAEHTDDL